MSAPLAGLRVVELTHMVMGPTCGLVLGDLGADVVKVEPAPEGDNTRRLLGSGMGFFAMYNRNKKSLAIDLKTERGKAALLKLVDRADIFVENFRPGAMDRMGFGYEALSGRNPRLIYVSHKGFQDGPYQDRTALDEVVQMMGGLAYMTGPPGQPLRAGASLNDVMGGMFGAIGVLSAVIERQRTGRGQRVVSSLFENTVFLMGQHMAMHAMTGKKLNPMSVRTPAWGVYDIFHTADGEQIFIGIVTDTQWEAACRAFGFDDLAADPRFRTNNDRVRGREWLIPALAERFGRQTRAALAEACETCGLPFAPIARPDELFDDPHLNASGGLLPVTLPDGKATRLPALPVAMDGARMPLRRDSPTIGADGREVLAEAGLAPAEIEALVADGIVVVREDRR
ncbi:CaiB/BaiF CoA transferase family protein [Elioraea rosea]|uniref:CaiB/BaiF CoA transferase family protein n=1 Tax=Elioraea rosea TaxID=2492390 RepID=UPI00118314C9|nr:CaiB/BaiF CoA-transferase family protein [Elioraea rosea]